MTLVNTKKRAVQTALAEPNNEALLAVCSEIEDLCIANGLGMRHECEKRMQCGLWELTIDEAHELLRQIQEENK